jgi:GT2 family glycosyltransferase
MGATVLDVRPTRPSAALGRNAGWRAARAPWVLFLDGDTILAPDFVAAALPHRVEARRAIVWGHRREIAPQASLFNRVLDLDWIYAPGPTEFCGGDALVRRAALEDVGGFDATLIAGEEPELCRRLRGRGWTILHLDVPMTGHDLAMTHWRQYWRRAFRAGHAYAEVAARFRASGDPFWQDVVRHNRLHGTLVAGLPLAALAAALALRAWWPLAAAALLLAALSLRTAWRVGWKSRDPLTRVLYGIHSHLQQVPILLGQLAWSRDQRRGRRRALIEYKEVR